MKHQLLILIAVLLAGFTSCKKDKEDAAPDQTNSRAALISGTWHTDYFYHENTDKTADMRNYNFTFNKDENLSVANSFASYNGTWNLTATDDKKTISFNITDAEMPQTILPVNGNWDVVSQTDTKIALSRRVNDDPETDYLTIEKN